MTLPAIIQKQNEKETVVRLKKSYTIASQAFMMAVNDHGTLDNWNLVDHLSPEGALNIMNKVAPYMKIMKNCGIKKGCLPDVQYKDINGNNSYNYNSSEDIWAKAQLNDGTVFLIQSAGDCDNIYYKGKQGICGGFLVDVNGARKPNRHGIDLFVFHITKNGLLVPGGDTSAISEKHTFDYNCIRGITDNFTAGGACTAWVLFNENLDYLHCSDLSWEGKHSCK